MSHTGGELKSDEAGEATCLRVAPVSGVQLWAKPMSNSSAAVLLILGGSAGQCWTFGASRGGKRCCKDLQQDSANLIQDVKSCLELFFIGLVTALLNMK